VLVGAGGMPEGNVRRYRRGPVRIAVDLMVRVVLIAGLGALEWYRRGAVLGITAGTVVLLAGMSPDLLRRLSGRLGRVLRAACGPVSVAAVAWLLSLAVQAGISLAQAAVFSLIFPVVAGVSAVMRRKRWPDETSLTQQEKVQADAELSRRVG